MIKIDDLLRKIKKISFFNQIFIRQIFIVISVL